MLFNSYEFIFLFLPITLLGFHLIGKQEHYRIAIAWLVGASLFFYGWWKLAGLGRKLPPILVGELCMVGSGRVNSAGIVFPGRLVACIRAETCRVARIGFSGGDIKCFLCADK